MTPVQLSVAVLTLLASGMWGIALLITWRGMRRVRLLGEVAVTPPPAWPRVSVIIPACNEAERLEAALQRQLRTTYSDVEFITIDDRSTDGTGRIIDRLAAGDRRLKPLHIRDLPRGWLGKVYAMHRGQQEATGQWLLFTDADVHIAPETLKQAVAFCEAEKRDYLTLIPHFLSTGNLLLDAAATLSIYGIFAGGRAWNVDKPEARQVAGFGAFILVRRRMLEQTAGLAWLRLEIADDLGLGLLMKQAGAACSLLNGREAVSLTFYHSLAEMRSSHEKGGFAIIGRFSPIRMTAFALVSLLFDFIPFLGFLPLGLFWLPLLGMTALCLRIAVLAVFIYPLRRPLLSALLFPAGSLINNWLLLRSGLVGWRNGGIQWRGTFYPTKILRNGQRVRFP